LVSTVLTSRQAVSGIDADDHPEDGERERERERETSLKKRWLLFSQIRVPENVNAFI
jgi:hypothetical protein